MTRTHRPSLPRFPRAGMAAAAVAGLLLAGCGSDGGTTAATTTAPDAASTTAGEPRLQGSITVSAAASLTESFTEIAAAFESANPGTTVTLTFDSSATLAQQILDGAPVDVYASADEANTAKLTDAGLVAGEPTVFARNDLVIVTKPGNPEGIGSLADLPGAGVISLCGEEVPCGRFAAQILEQAGVEIEESSVTRGQNVKAALTAVTEGDAVAAIVYATDATAAGEAVAVVDIPDADNAIASYPISVLGAAENPELAEAFLAFVLGDLGATTLADHGFLPAG